MLPNWLYPIWNTGHLRTQAALCKSCKGECSLWQFARTPSRWNPMTKASRYDAQPYREARFKREREDAKDRRPRYRA